MTDYTYDPTALNPLLAGLGAGAIGAIVASLVSLPLRSPDETIANTLSVTVVSLLVGVAGGGLWRRLRATRNGRRTFLWTQAGGMLVALIAVAVIDRLYLGQLAPYALPLAILIFASVALLTPLLAASHLPAWSMWLLTAGALLIGAGLLGRGSEVEDAALAFTIAAAGRFR